jgi:hypothetical protein
VAEGVDFVMREGKATLWSLGGVNTVLKLLAGAGAAPVEKEGAAAMVTLVVERPTANAAILLAYTLEGERVRCRVRDNAGFKPGMEITDCKKVNDHGLYVYKGRVPKKRKHQFKQWLAQFLKPQPKPTL